MVAYLTRMPGGIPGTVNRGFAALTEPVSLTPYGVTGRPVGYGVPIVIDNTAGNIGNGRIIASGDAVGSIHGILVRPYVTTGANPNDPLGTSTIAQQQNSGDLLRFGYVSVLLSGTTAAVKSGLVYVWTAAASGTHITGGFEASNPGGSGILIPATFVGPADSFGNTEISCNFMP